jgi:membrane protein DedA with SNARE-associated domain
MSPHNIASLIIEYRYLVIVPLAIIEGPIVAFVSGTLASLGYFNLYAILVFFFARDMIMDALYYSLGYFGSRTQFAHRMLKRLGVKEEHLKELHVLWDEKPGRTMFIGKFSYGIAQAFIVVAGMVKMELRKFFAYGALAAIAQYFTLILVGYFFGNAFGGRTTILVENLQYVIAGATLIISGYYIFRWYVRRKFKEEE